LGEEALRREELRAEVGLRVGVRTVWIKEVEEAS
jgi:hypothetical protein